MPWIYRMTMLASLAVLPLYIYVGRRLATAVSTISPRFQEPKKIRRRIVFPVIFWFYLFPLTMVIYYLNGNFRQLFVYNPQLQWQDYLIMYPSWCGLIAVLEIFPMFAALDIIRFVGRWKIFRKDKEKPRWQWMVYAKIGIALFFLVYVGIRTYLDTSHVRISTSEVAIENLPGEFNGLRLCVFGDIHMDRYTTEDKLTKLKDVLRSGDEDLLIFTGDLISKGFDYIHRALDVVGNPQAKVAALACMGDHDFWTDAQGIPPAMEKRGWTFLQNQHYLIPYKGRRILVTGLTYVYSSRMSMYQLKKLLGSAPEADLKILVLHQPMAPAVETAAEYGYHLLLAGHTHGGQIVHHVLGFPISPGQEETRFCWGRHRVKGMQVVVTNGIGLTLAPVRYHAPSEITKLTLVKK